jgi:hypothetical protein
LAPRQVEKGTDLPRSAAPSGATNRSIVAAVLARFMQDICVSTLLDLVTRSWREGGG